MNDSQKFKLIDFAFASPLAGLVVALEKLRDRRLSGSTPPKMFFEIKWIFQFIESLESARIEGNHTTLLDFIDSQSAPQDGVGENIQEIININKAMRYVETYFDSEQADIPITRQLIADIHQLVVTGLSREGDRNPGLYRRQAVTIAQSSHQPPDYIQVGDYMDELLAFINQKNELHYDFLKTAIAHHGFAWIHPFTNGNGRTARLLTYAMLIKQGFKVRAGRILNPSALFCLQREEYYHCLARADQGDEAGIVAWCEYMLKGLKNEIEKIDRLLDYTYLREEILQPALVDCREKKVITDEQYVWLEQVLSKLSPASITVKAADFNPDRSIDSYIISRKINKLKAQGWLLSLKDHPKKYELSVTTNETMLRAIINQLREKGFIPTDL